MVYRVLFLVLAAVVAPVWVGSVRAIEPPPEKTLATLADRMARTLPKGWAVEQDSTNGALVVSREERVLAMSSLPNLSIEEKPAKVTFSFCFRLGPLMDQPEFARLRRENEKKRAEMEVLRPQILREGASGKGDSFILPPASERGRALVARYDDLRESIHRLPDFFFEDASVWSIHPNSPSVLDDAIRQECAEVQTKVEGLLSKYPLAR